MNTGACHTARALLVASILGGLSSPSNAHPHLFIDGTVGFLFRADGRVDGVRITWTYDAFTSLALFQQLDLDADRDGVFDDADRAAIVAHMTDWPAGFDGNVHLDREGRRIALGQPENGEAWHVDYQVSVAFDLPVVEPVDAKSGIRLRLYDPTYYIAYAVTGLEETALPRCSASIDPFEADETLRAVQVRLADLPRGQTPEDDDIGALFADEVYLSCG